MDITLTTSVEQIDSWCRSAPESQHLEFKEARAQLGMARLHEYCVALANEGGGHLLLGITDKRPRAVVGTQAFRDTVLTAQRLHEALGFRVDVEEVAHPQGRVVLFRIPSRPLGTAYHLQGRYLMRSGEALVPMTEDRLRAVFSEGRKHWLSEFAWRGLSVANVIARLDTPRYFQLLKLPQPESNQAVVDRLVDAGLLVADAATYAVTNLARITLAHDIDAIQPLRRKAPRVILYDGRGKLSTIRDETMGGGYAARFEDLIKLIELQTPAREVIERVFRVDVRAYPIVAIRELVANALIHQDFEVSGASVMIEIYIDRIEISSPGQPSVQPERFIDGYGCRNELLASLMRRFSLCEEKGSGFDKVVRAVEEYHLPAPEIRFDSIRTTCILHGPREFSDMTRTDRVRACYQHCCVRYLSGKPMTNQSLRERFQLPGSQTSQTKTSQVIAAAQAAGRIKVDPDIEQSRRYARYLPYWA